MKVARVFTMLSFVVILTTSVGCGQTLPAEKFVFDPQLDSLYKAVSSKDTLIFESVDSAVDTLVLTNVDSVVSDKINCFMCPRAAKTIFRNYVQLTHKNLSPNSPGDTLTQSNRISPLQEQFVSITKFPDNGQTVIHLSFKTFRTKISGSLGAPSHDSLIFNNRSITGYYIINYPTESTIDELQIETLYISMKYGIIAYREGSGVVRKRLM